jgi:prolyl oligopeptidase
LVRARLCAGGARPRGSAGARGPGGGARPGGDGGAGLPDRVEWTKYYRPAWAADEKGFYYSAFPAPPAGQELTAKDLGCAVRLHRLGAGAGPDPVVYDRPDRPTWQFDLETTEDGRYLVITTGDGQVGDRGVEDVHVVDLGAKASKAVPSVEGFDAEYAFVTSEGPTLFFKTTNGAPKGRVIAIDARRPARAAWKTIVPEGEAPLRGAARAGDRPVVETLVDVTSRLRAYELDGSGRAELRCTTSSRARATRRR